MLYFRSIIEFEFDHFIWMNAIIEASEKNPFQKNSKSKCKSLATIFCTTISVYSMFFILSLLALFLVNICIIFYIEQHIQIDFGVVAKRPRNKIFIPLILIQHKVQIFYIFQILWNWRIHRINSTGSKRKKKEMKEKKL